jgi:hypothetical protein
MFFGADGAAAAATDELPSAPEKREQPKENENITEAARIMHLYNAWATLLNTDRDEVTKSSDGIFNKGSDVPRPPHLEDCRTNAERSKVFDSYGDNRTFPPWTLWKGSLGLEFLSQKDSEHADQRRQYPPWVCMLNLPEFITNYFGDIYFFDVNFGDILYANFDLALIMKKIKDCRI